MIARIIACSLLALWLSPPTVAQETGAGARFDLTDVLQLTQGTTGQFAQLFVPDYYQVPTDGKKVFLITHSSIPPNGYKSTSQRADHLLNALGAVRRPHCITDEIGAPNSSCDTGAFHPRGYYGETGSDHMKHLYGMHRMISNAVANLASKASELGEHSLNSAPSNPASGHYFLRLPTTSLPILFPGRGFVHTLVVLK